jgi:O6-methylguanine-DNA--protein-cysteine methyltransferase
VTSVIDYAAVAPAPVGLIGIRMNRVIAAAGGAGGFMGQRGGDALAIKTWLLDHQHRRP